MCVGSDIAALRAARVDALTGISNRAHIVQQLEARIQLADQALYAAKRAGRDQLMWAPTARKDTHEH